MNIRSQTRYKNEIKRGYDVLVTLFINSSNLDWNSTDPLLGHRIALFQAVISQVVISYHVRYLNKSINDKVLNPTEEHNPKDRLNIWENISNLSTTPHSCVKPMWDRITFFYKLPLLLPQLVLANILIRVIILLKFKIPENLEV